MMMEENKTNATKCNEPTDAFIAQYEATCELRFHSFNYRLLYSIGVVQVYRKVSTSINATVYIVVRPSVIGASLVAREYINITHKTLVAESGLAWQQFQQGMNPGVTTPEETIRELYAQALRATVNSLHKPR